MLHTFVRVVFLTAFLAAGQANAEQPWTFGNNTRYMALGDSLAAGYGATPTTQGYAYQLYQKGVYDQAVNTIFANAAVPGATSMHMLQYQVPQAIGIFTPDVITISIGGNDLIQVLGGADPAAVLGQFQDNLINILCSLRASLPQARIYIGNQYDIPEITSAVPGGPQLIAGFNAIVAGVATACSHRAEWRRPVRSASVQRRPSRPGGRLRASAPINFGISAGRDLFLRCSSITAQEESS
jgi:lysophospholipase L1-like esterase